MAGSVLKQWRNCEFNQWKLAEGALADSDTVGGNVAQGVQTTPTNLCAVRALVPNGKSYANAYWYEELGADPTLYRFIYELSFMFPTKEDAAACQAFEMDLQQVIGGVVYNWGWQFDYAQLLFRIWDRRNTRWITMTPISKITPEGIWTNVVVEGHSFLSLMGSNISYDSFKVDGVEQIIPLCLPTAALALPNMLNHAIQLDGNAHGDSYKVHIYGVNLTAEGSI